MIEIPNFSKHQKPHPHEPKNGLPRNVTATGGLQGGSAGKCHDMSLHVTAEGGLQGHLPLHVMTNGGSEGGSAGLLVECGIRNEERGKTSTPLTLAVPRPKPGSPHSAVGDWVEKIRAAHPKGSSEAAVAVWFAEQEQRLGDPQAFDDFAARVWRAHIAYCAYWAQDGNRFAKKLEDWLAHGEYDKTPPKAVSGQMRRLVDLLPPGGSHVG